MARAIGVGCRSNSALTVASASPVKLLPRVPDRLGGKFTAY